MCGGPSLPPVPEPVAPPSKSDSEVQAELEKERKRRRGMAGRSSTILTGSSGLGTEADTQKTILGA